MPVPTITELYFDDDNEAKIGWHHLSKDQVIEALQDRGRAVVRNRRGRRASHLIVGRDRSGRCIAFPVEPTHQPTVWRR